MNAYEYAREFGQKHQLRFAMKKSGNIVYRF